MMDPTLHLTQHEYSEWGNPTSDPDVYAHMYSFCPYQKLLRISQSASEIRLPSLLVTTSLTDSRVPYWGPTKFVSRLQSLPSESKPLALLISDGTGHFGAGGSFSHIEESSLHLVFLFQSLGLSLSESG